MEHKEFYGVQECVCIPHPDFASQLIFSYIAGAGKTIMTYE